MQYDVATLVGGFLYLRYINPSIVTPDAFNLISHKLLAIPRRNLILIAKVLQVGFGRGGVAMVAVWWSRWRWWCEAVV